MSRFRSRTFVLLLALTIATTALAAPAPKPAREYPPNVVDPDRQGGDTIFDAPEIPSLPFEDAGTTIGYTNDYDEACPYTMSTSPDVVYRYTATTSLASVRISLCGSNYDTKVYVYDTSMSLIGCNDDFYTGPPCGQYVSLLEDIAFVAGQTYYIVIDGYGGASGDYQLEINAFPIPCYEDHPDNEHEPPLVNGYVDTYNGGCDAAPPHAVQQIAPDADGHAFVSGRTGWFDTDGAVVRDTDWFELRMGDTGIIEVETCAHNISHVEEIAPQDCGAWAVVQSVTSIYWVESYLTLTGYEPGAPVWLRVRPVLAEPPPYFPDEYGYFLTIDGLGTAVAVEARSWSAVKGIFQGTTR